MKFGYHATNVFSVVASDGSLADWKLMPSPPPLGAGIASGMNGFYSGQALETDTIWVQPNSYITNYTVTATHPVHTNITETAALVVADICLEPITTETNSAGLVYNPCSVPTGQYRDFKIKVEPQYAIPDSHIKWVGNASFRNGQDKGRIVGLSPNQANQIVEIEIEGLVNAKPEINVTTTSSQTVPVRFMIVVNEQGVPATTSDQCHAWVAGANILTVS